jgi:hypothetical protein
MRCARLAEIQGYVESGDGGIASYLYQVHLYHRLESNDYGRFLADNDL